MTSVSPMLLTDHFGESDGGKCTHVFASPEALLESARGRKMLLCSDFVSIVAIMIDKAHCIVNWYVINS